MKSADRLIIRSVIIVGLALAPPASLAQTTSVAPTAESYMSLGMYDVRKQDFNGAREDFLGAWSQSPESPQIWLDLGLAESKLSGYELRAICWFKLYLMAVPDAANAEAVRRQIAALEAAYDPRLLALADKLESIILRYDAIRPLDQASANIRSSLSESRLGLGWDIATMRYAVGNAGQAELGLRRTNGDDWRSAWDRSWRGSAPQPDLASGDAVQLLAAIAASGRLDQAWGMLRIHDNSDVAGFFFEQGDGVRVGRQYPVYAEPEVIKACTPDELAMDAADRYQPIPPGACGVAQWWAAGRAAFLLRTAVNGVKLNTAHDETQMVDYLRDEHLETDSSELSSVTYELAKLALRYRKVRGLDRVPAP